METGARQARTAHEIFDLVRDDLRGVEKAIAVESVASVNVAMPASKYLRRSAAKRLRPALVLLVCARFAGGGSRRMAIQLGAVVEMLHAATLVHNDAIDADVPSANHVSVLAGDWLYIQAFRVALQERVLHMVLGVAQKMVLCKVNPVDSIVVTEAGYLDLVDRRMACLFSVCGKLGAVAGGCAEWEGEKLSDFAWSLSDFAWSLGDFAWSLGDFAWNLGMAFQLIEDTQDFAAWDSRVTSGRDAVQFANVRALVDLYGGIERTRARAQQFTDRARQILADFPDSPGRRALFALTDLV